MTALLDWATDATWAVLSDAYDGAANKVQPITGVFAQGVRPGRQLPAQYFNWLLSEIIKRVAPINTIRTITANSSLDLAGVRDGTVLFNLSGAITLALPDPSLEKVVGRGIRLGDATGAMDAAKKVTLTRFGSEKINHLAANYVLNVTFGRWTLVSDGTDWHLF